MDTGGPFQVVIRNGVSGLMSSSAITLHIRNSDNYDPVVIDVGDVGVQRRTIQAAIDSIGTNNNATNRMYLILVHPKAATAFNPEGAYRENIVVNRRVKIQGYGPGGTYADGTQVLGSVIDGQSFDPDGQSGTNWFNLTAQPHTGPDGVGRAISSPQAAIGPSPSSMA
jgi:pectin methylesterase-like acyl-CoA thioesterase